MQRSPTDVVATGDSILINNSHRIIAVIPARGGSKGVPRKNIADICGKPLLQYTIEVANDSSLIDACIVSTDDQEIADVACSLGVDVPFLRPREFAQDDSPDIDYLKHAVQWLLANRNWRPEIVVVLQPTLPLRTATDVDAALDFMLKEQCDSLRTISIPYGYTPYKMWFMDNPETGEMSPVLKTKYYDRLRTDVPRQLLKPVYWQNGVVIATRPKFILEGCVFGPDLRGFAVPIEHALDIDEPIDFKIAELLLQERQ